MECVSLEMARKAREIADWISERGRAGAVKVGLGLI
jgi:hypothetical protein